MPYLLGTNAIRRTRKYLEQGKIILRKNVKVMTIHFNDQPTDIVDVSFHKGARDFSYWHLCQIQYKNPDVQVINMRNLFPTPFIRCWLDTGEDVVMDVFGKNKKEILDHVIKILGQPQKEVQVEEKKDALEEHAKLCEFGSGRLRHCLCEIPGQVPCPAIIRLPRHLTGKYKAEHNLWPKRGLVRV